MRGKSWRVVYATDDRKGLAAIKLRESAHVIAQARLLLRDTNSVHDKELIAIENRLREVASTYEG